MTTLTVQGRSPLLALPLELRTLIYSELLCPTPKEPISLFGSPKGRPAALNIHPLILSANKQIYNEALPLLYSNIYRIELTSPTESPSCCGPYPDAPAELFLPPDIGQYLEVTRDWCYTVDGKLVSTKSKFHPYIFRRLRHVEIVTVDSALWGYGMLGPFWSHDGDLIDKISQCLSAECDGDEESEEEAASSKTLTFKLSLTRNTHDTYFHEADVEYKEIVNMVKGMITRLGRLRDRRDLTMTTELLSKNSEVLGDFDIEDWVRRDPDCSKGNASAT